MIDTATESGDLPSIDLAKLRRKSQSRPRWRPGPMWRTTARKASVINTRTNEVIVPAIAVGKEPNGIAISPNGTRVYVANGGSETVSVIDTATNQVTATTPLGGAGYAEAVAGQSKDGTRAYVSIYEPDPSVHPDHRHRHQPGRRGAENGGRWQPVRDRDHPRRQDRLRGERETQETSPRSIFSPDSRAPRLKPTWSVDGRDNPLTAEPPTSPTTTGVK